MRPDIHKYSFTAMASECEILLGGLAEEEAKVLAQSAQDEVKRIEHKYSRYREDSLLSEINNRSREAPVNCDQETLNLLQKADLLYRTSGGLFDATSGVLRQVWDFKKAELPNPEALEQLLSLIDWSALVCDGNTVSLSREGMDLILVALARNTLLTVRLKYCQTAAPPADMSIWLEIFVWWAPNLTASLGQWAFVIRAIQTKYLLPSPLTVALWSPVVTMNATLKSATSATATFSIHVPATR